MADKNDLPQEFPAIKSHEDLRGRANYRIDINSKAVRLTQILGSYFFNDGIRCGLSSCHHVHKRGYLVETDDGAETNIGWLCGKTHFGVDFTHKRKQYDAAQKAYRDRQAVRAVMASAESTIEELRSLQNQPYGGKWLSKSVSAFGRLYPAWMVDQLRRRAQKGDYAVSTVRMRTREELEIAAAANAGVPEERLKYLQEQAGVLVGLSIFAKPAIEHAAYVVPRRLHELEQLNADLMGARVLARWASWARGVDEALLDFEILIEEGRKFFRPDNLKLLVYLAYKPEDRAYLSRLSWDYDAASGIDTGSKRRTAG